MIEGRLESLHATRRPAEPVDAFALEPVQFDRLCTLFEHARDRDPVTEHLLAKVDPERRQGGRCLRRAAVRLRRRDADGRLGTDARSAPTSAQPRPLQEKDGTHETLFFGAIPLRASLLPRHLPIQRVLLHVRLEVFSQVYRLDHSPQTLACPCRVSVRLEKDPEGPEQTHHPRA